MSDRIDNELLFINWATVSGRRNSIPHLLQAVHVACKHMPTTVQQIFKQFNIPHFARVQWGQRFIDNNQGIYIVSTSNQEDQNLGITPTPNFANRVFTEWLTNCPQLTVDRTRPTIAALQNRLAEFWLPDENILYIGKADKRKNDEGLSCRICEFYNPRMGNNSHSGGLWIRTLSNLSNTTVYYCYCNNPKGLEEQMLEYFMSNVSDSTLAQLRDQNLPLPFANLQLRPGRYKNHGLQNQR